jgi:hypothetical protein
LSQNAKLTGAWRGVLPDRYYIQGTGITIDDASEEERRR